MSPPSTVPFGECAVRTALRTRAQARSTGQKLHLAALVAIVVLAPGFVPEARSQAASDFVAYPRNLTDFGAFTKETRNTRQLTFNRMPGLSPDYQMGPGDELMVTILGYADDSLRLKIDGDGGISIPLLGAVKIAGLTAEQVESAIAAHLKEKQLVTDPQVLVYIDKYEAKTVYVLGEVDRPGEYAVSFQLTLMDLIFVAGGVDFSAARYGYLHRRTSKTASDWRPAYVNADLRDLMNRPDVARRGSEVTTIDLQPMKDGGVLERNIILQNGDVFYVPRRRVELVYVIGDITKPGAFELPQEKRMTVAQAISWAGGPTKTAKMSKGILVRYDHGGQRREFAVDFAAVLQGRQPDIEIMPNDVIFIPGSSGKTLAYGLLNAIPSIVTSAILF